ncbi:hypothetical protein HHL19_16635 [Streptomyces sp. R302]|uniref:hypothetical protein n=1 Tax=unclassified Streptomyces TaxID=2593676 RepID=UPI00145C79A7|nr:MULTISPECIES: hypothetical protein [unclassified Streptomyces]NML55397.1 hypothetical protein [Streptomyces sp. R301]NML80269.1 hypothetical protein [Streptomyces sp. R302]
MADTTDLEARLGRPLMTAEAARAAALLDDASAEIRTFTGLSFSRVDDAEVVLRAQLGEIRLPQRPVIGVKSVTAIGAGGAPDVAVVGWQWDGLDIIRVASCSPSINLPEAWYDEDVDAYPGTYRVVYSYGDAEAPAIIVTVACRMVLRTLTAPTMAGGVVGETIGPYTYRTDGSGAGTAVTMTDEDRKMLVLGGFRQTVRTSIARYR